MVKDVGGGLLFFLLSTLVQRGMFPVLGWKRCLCFTNVLRIRHRHRHRAGRRSTCFGSRGGGGEEHMLSNSYIVNDGAPQGVNVSPFISVQQFKFDDLNANEAWWRPAVECRWHGTVLCQGIVYSAFPCIYRHKVCLVHITRTTDTYNVNA